MRELVGDKNTVGRTAAVLKKPHKATFTFCLYLVVTVAVHVTNYKLESYSLRFLIFGSVT